MTKREFLIASGAVIANTVAPALCLGQAALTTLRKNWAGNLTYASKSLQQPASTDEVSQVVKASGSLKALGTRHSFDNIADTNGDQVSLKHFDSIDLDPKARTVTVGAGVTYGQLAPYLDSRGFALHNLASLPHISVVGGCSTGTHGSGIRNGNLSTAVQAIEIVLADGEVKVLSRASMGETFFGAVVGLGALGVITRITLAVQPSFSMTQVVYENLSFDQLEHNLVNIFSSGYSVSLFTNWQGHQANQVWIKRRVEAGQPAENPPVFYGARAATRKLHPISGVSAENCTEQMGIPGRWYERLPHFRMEFTPSAGSEMQTEYFVPLEKGYEAILAVEQIRDQITPHLFASEFRTIDADDLWLSPAYKRRSMALHFTWKLEWPEVKQILPQIEAKLAPFAPRPHWAKLFTVPSSQLSSQYVKMSDFKSLVAQYDPKGKFRNDFLSRNLYGA